VVTIGGGSVVDITPPGRAPAPMRLDVLGSSDAMKRIALLVRESEFGMPVSELVSRTGLRESEIAAAAAKAPLVKLADGWYVDRDWFQAARARLVKAVAEFHQTDRLAPGIAKQDLRARQMASAPPNVIDALLAGVREIVVDGETVRLASHRVVLQQDEEQARSAIEQAFAKAGLAVPFVADVLAASGVESKRARTLLEILIRERRLTRISQDLVFHVSALEQLKQLLTARKSQRFQVGDFKEWTGISRKYAIPLLEYLDREHVTRREGEQRLIL
jgi:selenocysteine-specific elongation factor